MYRESRFRKQTAVMVSLVTVTAVLAAGCAGQGVKGTQEGSNSDSAVKAPVVPQKVKMMIPYWNPEPPKQDTEPMNKIQEYTKSKLEILWTPAVAYKDKFNAGIAGQDLPQVVYVLADANKDAGFVNAVRSSMFWEIGPYLKDYPNLSKLSPQMLKESSVDGKVYGIYKDFPQARDGIIIRKDWLDNLGLKEPKTLDELLAVMKAFVQKDPDKNGKNDTFGFGVNSDVTGFGSFVTFLGGPNSWEYKDNQIVPSFMTKPYMDTLKLYKQLYDENIINRDFAVMKSPSELLNKGKAGIYMGPLDDVESRFSDLYKGFPNAQLDVISSVEGPSGMRVNTRGIFPPQFTFPKINIKTEAELKDVLAFMDKMADKDMQNLFTWGLENTHYKMENNKPVRTDSVKYTTDIAALDFLRYDDGSQAMKGSLPPVVEKYKRLQAEAMKIAIPNPVQALISPTFTDKGSELTKVINDARTKFIMGEINEAGWDAAVALWKKNGGEKVIKEYTEQYEKLNKK
ncbi:extracellular solute-binding protein [Paenibacillus sp. P36]|uniref:extracellular solute-binding protein n=1 Tax=Paenibacillus sp. P36 TaxID=3342538 RepID=UPI0038B26664